MEWRVDTLDICASTQAEIIARIERSNPQNPDHSGLVVRAARQNDGVGRYKRSWIMELGDLAFSFAVKPKAPLRFRSSLSLVAGLALADVCSDETAFLKWPNDMLTGEFPRKSAGILCDIIDGYFVIGIGVNLVRGVKGADYGVVNCPYDAAALMQAFLRRFSKLYHIWDSHGFSVLRQDWLRRSMALGSPMSVKQGADIIKGFFDGVNDDGALLLRLENDAINVIASGELVT